MNIRKEKGVAIVSGGNGASTLSQWGPLVDELDQLDCAAVIEARLVFGGLTEIEAYILALRANGARKLRCHRMAVVTSGEALPDLDFFIKSIRNCGQEIESFDGIDAAAAWASANGPSDPGTLDSGSLDASPTNSS